MARKTATGVLVLDGLEIRKSQSGKLCLSGIVQADSSDMETIDLRVSTEEVARKTKITSLDLRVSKAEVLRGSNDVVDELAIYTHELYRGGIQDGLDNTLGEDETTRRTGFSSGTDVRISFQEEMRASNDNSHDLRVSKEEDASNLCEANHIWNDAQETAMRQSNVNSIDLRLSKEEVYVQKSLGIAINGQVSSLSVDFSAMGFDGAPAIMGQLRDTSGTGNIIAAQLSGAATSTGCTFVFSDEIPGTENVASVYVLDMILAKNN